MLLKGGFLRQSSAPSITSFFKIHNPFQSKYRTSFLILWELPCGVCTKWSSWSSWPTSWSPWWPPPIPTSPSARTPSGSSASPSIRWSSSPVEPYCRHRSGSNSFFLDQLDILLFCLLGSFITWLLLNKISAGDAFVYHCMKMQKIIESKQSTEILFSTSWSQNYRQILKSLHRMTSMI